MTQNVNSPIEIKKGVARNLSVNWEAAKVERYNRWQSNYSIHTCQQSAILGSAEARMVDMIAMIRQSKYNRHEVKKALNKLDVSTLERWHEHFSSVKGTAIMAEIIDEAASRLNTDIQKLYWAVKADMDKQRIPDSQIKAEVYTVALLVDISCQMFDFHVALGPRPGNISDEGKKEIEEWYERHFNGSDEPSPYYDADYERWLQGMRPTKMKMQMGIICQGVCGTWSHDMNGNVPLARKIIITKSTSLEFLDKCSLQGLLNSGEYDAELEKLNRMETIRHGQITITIDLLDAIRLYIDGSTDEEIRAELYKILPNAKLLGEDRIDRIMNIVRMMRLMDEHPEAVEQFNELEQAWGRGGREEALRIHNERMERINREEKAKKKAKKQTISFADDKEKEELTEQEMLMARLADKFGKVGTFLKPKKSEAKVATMIEEQREKEEEFVFPDDLPTDPIEQEADATCTGAKDEESRPTAERQAKQEADATCTGAKDEESRPTAESEQEATGEVHEQTTEESKQEATAEAHEEATAEAVPLAIQPEERKRAARRWTEDEENYVAEEVENHHTPFATIGKLLHRTESAIRQRYDKILRERKKKAAEQEPEKMEF